MGMGFYGVKISSHNKQMIVNNIGLWAWHPAMEPALITRMKRLLTEWNELHKTSASSDWGNIIYLDPTEMPICDERKETVSREAVFYQP